MVISPLAAVLSIRVLLTGYFVLAAPWDFAIQRGRVPNWLTVPPLIVAGIIRLYQRRWEALIFWGALLVLWRLHLFGGGDAKLLMFEAALFPAYDFLLITAVSVILVGGGILFFRAFKKEELVPLGRRLAAKFLTLRLFPSEEEFRAGAEPSTYLFCVGAILYTWLLW